VDGNEAAASVAYRASAPGDLPIEQSTKFESRHHSLKAAKALGLTIPPVLLRANQVTE
jgi:hypothetical protein